MMETSLNFKKRVGGAILKINSDVLALQKGYKKLKDGVKLSAAEEKLEKSVSSGVLDLEKDLSFLEENDKYVKENSIENYIGIIKTTVDTAHNVLDVKHFASETVKTLENMKKEAESCLSGLQIDVANTVNNLNIHSDVEKVESLVWDDDLTKEFDGLNKHVGAKFQRILSEINKKMTDQLKILNTAWADEKESLDYQALKDIRYEFDLSEKKLRSLIGDWDKRKHSELLTDYLEACLNNHYDEYINIYSVMANEKRKEAAIRRKKEQQILEYKNEKKRPVPSWPEKVPYSKFKPDLLSWDVEHFLSSGASKFGQFVEMLKKEGRFVTYEQVSTRLRKLRNDENIISKVVELLDSINEETCFNKLSRSWDTITSLKRNPSETLNDFFSRFETIQYNLNMADDSYKEHFLAFP